MSLFGSTAEYYARYRRRCSSGCRPTRSRSSETWTVDELIGLAYSTSFASLARVGERRDEFERALRARLEPEYRERVRVDALLGRRSDQ